MKRGNSGAQIIFCKDNSVMKISGIGLLEQAYLCDALYPVTPRILSKTRSVHSEAYTMELLQEPLMSSEANYGTLWAIDTLRRVRGMLWYSVWTKPFSNPPAAELWIKELCAFIIERAQPEELDAYGQLIEDLFVARPLDKYSMIHGDPTLANTMVRTAPLGTISMLVLCDPIPPKGKIPPHFTVDLGKLLQSAIGWEAHQFGWRYSVHRCIKTVLEGYEKLDIARAWFWCAVHCLRILPYADKMEDRKWARERARISLDHARGAACSMPLI